MLVKKRALTNKQSSSTNNNNDDDSVAVETTARLRSEPAKVGVMMKKLVKLSERRKKVSDSSTMAAASTNGLNIDTSATSGGYNSTTNKYLASPTQSVTTYTTLKVDNRKKASKNNFYDEADLDSIDRFSSYTDTVDYADKLPNNNTMAELDVDQDCAAILLTKVDNMCGGMFSLIKQEKHCAAAMDMEKFWDRVTGSSVDEDEQWTLYDNTVDGDDNTLADHDGDDGLAYYSHSFATTIESGSLGTNGCAATIESGSSTDDSNTIGSNTIGSNTVDTAISRYTGASAPSLGAGVSSLSEARPPRGSMPKTKHDNQGTSVSAVSSLNSRPRTESTDCSSAQEKAFVSPPSKEKKASETPSKTDNRVRAGSLDFPPSTLSPKPNVANSSRQTYKNGNEQDKTSVPPPSQEEEASKTPIKSGNIVRASSPIGIATKPIALSIRKTQKNNKGVSPRIFDKMFFHKGRRSTGRVVAKASKHQKEEDAEYEDAEVMKYLGKKTCTVIDYDYSGAVELAEFDQAEEDRDEIRQDDIPFPVVWTPDPEERDIGINEWPHSLKRMTTNDIIFQAQEMLNLDTVRS